MEEKEEGEERKKDRTDGLYLNKGKAFQKLSMHCNIAFAYIGNLQKGGVLQT